MTVLQRIRRKLRAFAKPAAHALPIDLDAPEIARDPFPHYDALRAKAAVQFLDRHHAWFVFGHEELQWVFLHPELFSNKPYEDVDAVLLAADPPDHTAVRRALNPYFSRDVIEQLGVFAAERAAQLLQRERLDAVADYARPLSEAVAARMLGFDEPPAPMAGDFAEYVRALDAGAHRTAMFERLRGDGFDDAQARSLVRLFWVASTATTERVIAQCVLALLRHRDVRERVANDHALIAPFVDEVMRMHPPEPMLRRLATSDVKLAGARIPSGSMVYLSLAAANRDPRRYEHPNELRLDRGAARHLTFGHGIHYCIGASLGRATIHAALRALLAGAPTFRAAQPLDSVRYVSGMMVHFVESLTIET